MPRGATTQDITGERFGSWTVIERRKKTKSGKVMWLCKCDCGTVKYVAGLSLKNGTSAGCHACLWDRQLHPRAHTDGSRRWVDNKPTTPYRRWRAMKERCNNPNNKAYKNYGARGIKVCDEWNNDFQNYWEYVSKLEHYGEPGYTLDRIDNERGYEPGNVRWATKSEQEKNKRKGLHRKKRT